MWSLDRCGVRAALPFDLILRWWDRLSRLTDRFSRRREGSVAVEFAILLPIFLLFLFGTIQFGLMLYVQNDMINAAREAARRLSVDDSTTEAQAETVVETYLAKWPFNFTIQAEDSATTGDDTTRVTVSVPMSEAAVVVDIIGAFVSRTLTARVVMREES